MSITDSVPKSFVFRHESEQARHVATQGFLLVSGVGFRKYSPDPDVLAQEIVKDLEAALEQFRESPRTSVASIIKEIEKKIAATTECLFTENLPPCSFRLAESL